MKIESGVRLLQVKDTAWANLFCDTSVSEHCCTECAKYK
jgi:hypothetical protein